MWSCHRLLRCLRQEHLHQQLPAAHQQPVDVTSMFCEYRSTRHTHAPRVGAYRRMEERSHVASKPLDSWASDSGSSALHHSADSASLQVPASPLPATSASSASSASSTSTSPSLGDLHMDHKHGVTRRPPPDLDDAGADPWSAFEFGSSSIGSVSVASASISSVRAAASMGDAALLRPVPLLIASAAGLLDSVAAGPSAPAAVAASAASASASAAAAAAAATAAPSSADVSSGFQPYQPRFEMMWNLNRPLDWQSNEGAEACSNVLLFPYGDGEFAAPRFGRKLSLAAYFLIRMHSVDNRFRLSPSYQLWCDATPTRSCSRLSWPCVTVIRAWPLQSLQALLLPLPAVAVHRRLPLPLVAVPALCLLLVMSWTVISGCLAIAATNTFAM